MEHQTHTYEQPQMDVIVTDGGITTDDFGINIGLIGQKVCPLRLFTVCIQ